jgi:hypothetical protein
LNRQDGSIENMPPMMAVEGMAKAAGHRNASSG